MKKLLLITLSVFLFSGVFAQEKSVAIVRHITLFGGGEKQQRLVISKPDGITETVALQQRYSDIGNAEQIASDNQEIIKVFTALLNDGYELKESNSTAGGPGQTSAYREIMYIFVKN